jgi:hypothetical protein
MSLDGVVCDIVDSATGAALLTDRRAITTRFKGVV